MRSNAASKDAAIEKGWLTPERFGLLGLGIGVAIVVIMSLVGPDSKQPFWMAVDLALIIGLSALAICVVTWSAARALRGNVSGLASSCVAAVAMLFIGWAILFPSRQCAKQDIAMVNEICGFTDALLCYVERNNGRFPESLVDLIDGGFIKQNAGGRWLVSCRDDTACVLRDPTWFDVAWGITSDQLDANGVVVGEGHALVRPAPKVPAPKFDLVCRSISNAVGQHLAAWNHVQNESFRSSTADSMRGSPSIKNLLRLTDAELARLDLAAANLACAAGLPGAESLDATTYLAKLDQWAEAVRRETERRMYRFRQRPSDYGNSEAYFRLLCLTTVLQQDCGVRYNPEAIRDVDFSDPRDQFIHGILDGHGGTCVSFPVLYVAVGRRLGYPVKLSMAVGHIFARWEDPVTGERINFEAAGNGMVAHPDDHYRTWPKTMSPEQIASGEFLVSLSSRQELAHFVAARGHCLMAHQRWQEAETAYRQAHDLCPGSEVFEAFLRDCEIVRIQNEEASSQGSAH